MKKLSDYRSLFPICEDSIYLNHAGVAPTSLPVCDAVHKWMLELARRGIHMGANWEEQADEVRASAGRLVGAGAHEISFIRNTSHGLGLVAEGIDWQSGDEVICCPEVEYQSNVYVWQHLSHYGVRVAEVEAQEGGVTVEAVERVRTDKTRLLAVSAVQFATGHKTDLKALGDYCKKHDLLFCVDGIQWLGSAPLDVKEYGIHFLAADSHKWMLGVVGIGLLYIDESMLTRLRPVLVGWKSTTAPLNSRMACATRRGILHSCVPIRLRYLSCLALQRRRWMKMRIYMWLPMPSIFRFVYMYFLKLGLALSRRQQPLGH